MPHCQACDRGFEVRERVGFREACEGCGADLHVCLNCEFHDPGAHNQCREPQADPVPEKDRANRCDWFRASSRVPGEARDGSRGVKGARSAIDALFGKPGDGPPASGTDPKDALDALFRKKKP